MSVIPPWAMDSIPVDPNNPGGERIPAYDGASLRAIYSALLGGGDTATTARPGVISGLDVTVVGETVYVGSGLCVVTTAGGSFITGLSQEVGLDLDPRHATNARIDRLVMEVVHTATEREARARIVPGTPAPSPQAPPIPADAENLGTISVPNAAGGPPAFTPQQRYTAGRGGIITVPNMAALNRLPQGTPNQPAFASVAGGVIYRSTGDGWRTSEIVDRYQLTGDDVYEVIRGTHISTLGADAHVTVYGDGSKSVDFSVHQTTDDHSASTSNAVGRVRAALRPGRAVAVTGFAGTNALIGSMDGDGYVYIRWASTPASNAGILWHGSYSIPA